ncbi:MAG: hypothetical protein EBY17_13325 [Acidobacteriia bacterium]|jgi:hypothetical protein|nr:hypothetical protein [Terriglobia bacterium]
MRVRLDLNNPEFQKQWFDLEKEEQLAVLQCCEKLVSLDWAALYRDKGLRWEVIHSRTCRGAERVYSIRITKKMRAVVKRTGDYIEFLTLHSDHDSAYKS